ncbi:hypothetical protein GIB67_016270 [Kingdonia uniflora]|uniref:nicotinate phosphoribosyltransferase n=1 Tax=Kingdonia uniflora TaxID=39325 RepID=A0A7J7M9N3_9MAGN|nr:hypothetical protein GIB67_016270 [Kingdonia uniflora]
MEVKENGLRDEEEIERIKLKGPTNPMVSPLLTDQYQFTMAYAYWKAGKHQERAVGYGFQWRNLYVLLKWRELIFLENCWDNVRRGSNGFDLVWRKKKGNQVLRVLNNSIKYGLLLMFDLFFRKNPFGGEYTIFAGLEECIRFIANFKFTEDEISFLRSSLPPTCEVDDIVITGDDVKGITDITLHYCSRAIVPKLLQEHQSKDKDHLFKEGFFDYLKDIDCSGVEVYAAPEGSVVFPKIPLLRVEGPIAVVQLLETPFVNLINFASLVATNAARHRFVAGKSKMLLEFGLRRAQGPDGGISASKYCYMGGFDATRLITLTLYFDMTILVAVKS